MKIQAPARDRKLRNIYVLHLDVPCVYDAFKACCLIISDISMLARTKTLTVEILYGMYVILPVYLCTSFCLVFSFLWQSLLSLQHKRKYNINAINMEQRTAYFVTCVFFLNAPFCLRVRKSAYPAFEYYNLLADLVASKPPPLKNSQIISLNQCFSYASCSRSLLQTPFFFF